MEDIKKIGFKVITEIKRPDKALVEGFRGLPTANVDDCMGKNAAVDPSIKARNKATVLGTAITVKSPARDNTMIHKAIDMAQPGDVIVIAADGGMECALCGDIMMNYCKLLGLGGLIIDGCIRDIDEISQMEFPVFAKGINPNGPLTKTGPGEINVPVMFGGKIVCPGDIILGDETGLIVIKQDEAAEILKNAKALNKKESELLENLAKGIKLERSWIDEVLKKNGCEIV